MYCEVFELFVIFIYRNSLRPANYFKSAFRVKGIRKADSSRFLAKVFCSSLTIILNAEEEKDKKGGEESFKRYRET